MSAYYPTPTKKGLATIVWGCAPGASGGSVGTQIFPVVTGFNPTSLSLTPTNAGPVAKIENSDGSIISKVYLDDGFEGECEGLYDSALTYPAQGAAISVTLPAGLDFAENAIHTVFPCTVESQVVKFARKKEAMVTFKFSYNPGVEGAPTT